MSFLLTFFTSRLETLEYFMAGVSTFRTHYSGYRIDFFALLFQMTAFATVKTFYLFALIDVVAFAVALGTSAYL